MKLFKFILYSFAFFIGLSIAFCSNSNYDSKSYSGASDSPVVSAPTKTTEKVSESYQNGKKLFRANCAACHNKNMIDDMTGPALKGTLARWEGREALLYKWIRNSPQVIASGDPYAVDLYVKYSKAVMTAFPNLSDDEIKNLLDYIEGVK